MTTVLEALAKFVAETKFVPDKETISIVRDAFIDTLGCVLVGARQPVAKNTLQTLAAWGSGTAPVYGTGLMLPPPWAAMANATAGHALDFDDWEIPGNTHSSIAIFPALLAVATGMETPVSGKAILDAYLAGFEVIARLGEAINFEHYALGWHSTVTLGAIGSAAAVARILGLNVHQTMCAMSLAVSQAVGYTCQFGSNAKPLQAGMAAKAGVLSAALAQNGLTGQPHVIETHNGLNSLMAHGDQDRVAAVFADFPKQTLALSEYGLVMKPYPSCGYTHRVIDCARIIQQMPDFDATSIVRITASLPDFHAGILPFMQPTERAEALFSAPFCVSLTLLGRTVSLAEIEAEAWTEPVIMDLIAKTTKLIRTPINPELNYDPGDPDWVKVEMADGTVLRAEVAYPLGDPHNRMSSTQLMQKFLLNAAIDLEQPAFTEVIHSLQHWIEKDNIMEVVAPFAFANVQG
ncbi:MAG: MmgE/PrpD family protein [Chloroflexota bacterium]